MREKGPIENRYLSLMLASVARRPSRIRGEEKMTPQEKGRLAIEVFEKAGNPWAVKFFQVWEEGGPTEIWHWLARQNVFSQGKRLLKPDGVFAGMEITNLKAEEYPVEMADKIRRLTKEFFEEYTYIEQEVLRLPDLLGGPLLLRRGIEAIQRELRKTAGAGLGYLTAGAGAGNELIPILKQRLASPVVADMRDTEEAGELIRANLAANGLGRIPVVDLGEGQDIRIEELERWKNLGRPIQVMLVRADMTQKNALSGLVGHINIALSNAIYVLHELTEEGRVECLRNMSGVTRGPVVIIDGLPTVNAMTVGLGVFKRLYERRIDLRLDAFGFTASHLLGLMPEEARQLAMGSVPNRLWEAEEIAEPRKRLLGNLQMKLTGSIV